MVKIHLPFAPSVFVHFFHKIVTFGFCPRNTPFKENHAMSKLPHYVKVAIVGVAIGITTTVFPNLGNSDEPSNRGQSRQTTSGDSEARSPRKSLERRIDDLERQIEEIKQTKKQSNFSDDPKTYTPAAARHFAAEIAAKKTADAASAASLAIQASESVRRVSPAFLSLERMEMKINALKLAGESVEADRTEELRAAALLLRESMLRLRAAGANDLADIIVKQIEESGYSDVAGIVGPVKPQIPRE
jgi:hypothetical protein